MIRAALALALLWLSCLLVPGGAGARQEVALSTKFAPALASADTSILLGFDIRTTGGAMPAPLTGLTLRLPAGVSIASSALGLATCSSTVLELQGLSTCSPNAFMGRGSATVGVRVGPGVVHEPVDISILMGVPVHEHTAMLFYASGGSPVIARLVFPSVLLPDSGLFGAKLDTTIPPIAILPGAPDAAILNMHASIGPRGLTYYQHVHGHTVGYSPSGIRLPRSCPQRGYRFVGIFTFQDGTSVTTKSVARCHGGGSSQH
jgi:hypothetical protein